LQLIVAPQLSGGQQHNYSAKTRQAGCANKQSNYPKCCKNWNFWSGIFFSKMLVHVWSVAFLLERGHHPLKGDCLSSQILPPSFKNINPKSF
jgi:hypothetical protein